MAPENLPHQVVLSLVIIPSENAVLCKNDLNWLKLEACYILTAEFQKMKLEVDRIVIPPNGPSGD